MKTLTIGITVLIWASATVAAQQTGFIESGPWRATFASANSQTEEVDGQTVRITTLQNVEVQHRDGTRAAAKQAVIRAAQDGPSLLWRDILLQGEVELSHQAMQAAAAEVRIDPESRRAELSGTEDAPARVSGRGINALSPELKLDLTANRIATEGALQARLDPQRRDGQPIAITAGEGMTFSMPAAGETGQLVLRGPVRVQEGQLLSIAAARVIIHVRSTEPTTTGEGEQLMPENLRDLEIVRMEAESGGAETAEAPRVQVETRGQRLTCGHATYLNTERRLLLRDEVVVRSERTDDQELPGFVLSAPAIEARYAANAETQSWDLIPRGGAFNMTVLGVALPGRVR